MVYRGLVSGGQFKLQESASLLNSKSKTKSKSKSKTKTKITLKERERSPFEFEFEFEFDFDFSTIFVINQLIMPKKSSDKITKQRFNITNTNGPLFNPFAALYRYS